MPRPDPTETGLQRLAAMDTAAQSRPGPAAWSQPDQAFLASCLSGKRSLLVARAADLIAEHNYEQLSQKLAPRLDSLLQGDAKADPQCRAKVALCKAIIALHVSADELFVTGSSLRQWEPVWGGQVDTAAELRGQCGLGLVLSSSREALGCLVQLLADPEPTTRRLAAEGLACLGTEAAEALLKFRLLTDEEDGEVVAAICHALMDIDSESALTFLRPMALQQEAPHLAEEALVAMAESRQPEAVAILMEAFAQRHLFSEQLRLIPMFCIARCDAGYRFLRRLYQDGDDKLRREIDRCLEDFAVDARSRTLIQQS